MEPSCSTIIKLLAVLLVFTSTLTSCEDISLCNNNLFNNKLTYKYETNVLIGVDETAPAKSLFKLRGDLVIHKANQEASSVAQCDRFQLQNVQYNQANENSVDSFENAPTDASALNKPFYAVYSKGNCNSLLYSKEDQEWSLNIKKALADIFQLPVSSLEKEGAFTQFENSVYGTCKAELSSFLGNNAVETTKVYFSNDCKNDHFNDTENVSSYIQSNDFEDFNGIRRYKINKKDYGIPVIQSIEGSEKIHSSDVNVLDVGDRKFIVTKLKITLKKLEQTSESNDLSNNHYETTHSLNYNQKPSDNPFGLFHVTNGRNKYQGNHYEMAISKLNEACDYINENQLGKDSKEISRSQVIGELLTYLRYFSVDDFDKLYSKVTSSEMMKKNDVPKHLFYEIISKVGTKSSVRFIINLLKNNNSGVDSRTVSRILINMPFYIMNYSPELIPEVQVLLNKPDAMHFEHMNERILAFSVIFGKVCGEFGPNQNSRCDSNTIDLITDHFFKGITENQNNHNIQLCYLEGLKNLRVPESVKYLEKIITEDGVDVGNDLRLRALSASSQLYSQPPKEVLKIALPILENKNEPAEMRAAALSLVMESQLNNPESEPFTLHWHMENEKCPHLYHYYYTLLKSYAESSNPLHKTKKSVAEKYLKMSRVPSRKFWESSVRVFTDIPASVGSKTEVVLKTFSDGKGALPNSFNTEVNSVTNRGLQNYMNINVRTKGVQSFLLNSILKGMKSPASSTIMEIFTSTDDLPYEPLYLEFILQKQGYTVSTAFAGATPEEKLARMPSLEEIKQEIFSKLIASLSDNDQSINFNTLHERVLMTGTGVPVVMNVNHPRLSSWIGDIKPVGDELNVQLAIRRLETVGANLLVFNPVANTWHGHSRMYSEYYQLPINAGIKFNKQDGFFQFTLKKSQDEQHVGMQMTSRTFSTFFEGSSLIPTNFMIENKESNQIVDSYQTEMPDVGYSFHLTQEGCNIDLPQNSYSAVNQEDNLLPGMDFWSKINTLRKSSVFEQPMSHNCSRSLYFHPTANNLGSQFSMSIKVINGKESGPVPLPGYYFTVKGTIAMKSGSSENGVKTWNIVSDVSSSPNGISTSIKSKISSSVNGVTSGPGFVVDFEKTFPPLGKDAFEYGWGDESVLTKLTVKCKSDGNDCGGVSMAVKGEISDEQKQLAKSNVYPYGQCEMDKKKPEWSGPLVPRTWACFEGAIRLFYTRKITLQLATKNLSPELVDTIGYVSSIIGNKYLIAVEPQHTVQLNENERTLNMTITHGAVEPKMNIDLYTHSGSYKFRDVPGINSDIFNLQLDNTHFSKWLLYLEATAIDRNCVTSVSTVLTPDNATISHVFGSNYEVLSALKSSGKYSVSVKKGSSGLVAKVLLGDATIELSGNSATLNGKAISLDKGFQYPANDPFYYARLYSNQGQITLYSQRLGIYVVYTPSFVILDQPIILKGFVDGLCGNLNGNPNDDEEKM